MRSQWIATAVRHLRCPLAIVLVFACSGVTPGGRRPAADHGCRGTTGLSGQAVDGDLRLRPGGRHRRLQAEQPGLVRREPSVAAARTWPISSGRMAASI